MHKILAVVLLLFVIPIYGQDDIYLLQSVYIVDEYHNPGDTSDYDEYIYHDEWSLDQVIWHWYNDTIYERFEFSNDTLIYSEKKLYYKEYNYFNDSVIIDVFYYDGSQKKEKCFLDNQNRIIEYHRVYPHEEINFYEWEQENVVSSYSQKQGFLIAYYDEYFNPYYNQNKNLRFGIGGGLQYTHHVDDTTYYPDHEYRVMESIGGYPSLVHFYYEAVHYRNYIFNYHILTGNEEIPAEKGKVLSVSYFNHLGQEIEKPKKGFFIERKTTNKGVISKKYFIQ